MRTNRATLKIRKYADFAVGTMTVSLRCFMNDITIAMIFLEGIILIIILVCAFVFGKDYKDKKEEK